jgi:hypothetical protein
MSKHKTYVRLIANRYPFKAGTEFVVTGGDSGSGSGYAFYSGTVLLEGKHRRISVERKDCEYISAKDFKHTVIAHEKYLNRRPMTDSEFWDDWINSPG